MGKRLDGTSLFTGINSGLTNTFAQLASQYSDGLTLENLQTSLTNSNLINTSYGATFASYMTNNFSNLDADGDGKADTGTKKAEVMEVIDSLPLTSSQKDALYYAEGWAKSKLYEAPWH